MISFVLLVKITQKRENFAVVDPKLVEIAFARMSRKDILVVIEILKRMSSEKKPSSSASSLEERPPGD